MALMAGIYLDTKNFNVRTGERTFAAAAYLRQLGVDTVAVKMLFQSDYGSTLTRHEIVQSARSHTHGTAIAMYTGEATRPIAAQAADEILNITGVTTSFVLFKDGDKVIISARSIGDANVQMILEPFSGGGNPATAGAQISGMSLESVAQGLRLEIDKFYAK
jgi:c-di-AMP phosphodiesterase-like protein